MERNHTSAQNAKNNSAKLESEHSYGHSHWRESPHVCTAQIVIQTNWKIEEAHIHRQWRKATQLNYRVPKVIQHSWNLGHTFAYAHWREAPPLYRVLKIIGRNGILKNHMLTHSGERSHICRECEKSIQAGSDLRFHLLIHTGVKPILLPDPNQEHALRHK